MTGRPKITDAERIAAEKEKAKSWRKNTVKFYDSTSKISEMERAVLANDKYDDVTVWAMQAFCIDPNPVLFYKATHVVKENEPIANIIKKADTFINNPTMVSAIRLMKKDIAGKTYIPASIRRRVMLEKEVSELEKMAEGEGLLPDIEKDDMIKMLEKALYLDPQNYDAMAKLIDLRQWKKQEETQEEDVYAKLTHYYLPFDCSKCERRGTPLCSGCSIYKQDNGELTDAEIELANKLANKSISDV